MKKAQSKQVIAAAFLAAVIGVSGAPLSVNAQSGDSNQHHSQNRGDWQDRERRDHDRRHITEWQAKRIAQDIFPRKDIKRIVLRSDDGRREYQVRFADGSRVDVRTRDGQVTYIHNDSRRYSHDNWR